MTTLDIRRDAPPTPTTRRPRVLVLTTSLLTDRMCIHSGVVRALSDRAEVTIWAGSHDTSEAEWSRFDDVTVEPFPEVIAYRQRYSVLRRLNDFAWDFVLATPGRESLYRHQNRRTLPWSSRMMRGPARLVAWSRTHQWFENRLVKWLEAKERSAEATARLEELQPDLVVTLGPFQFEQPGVVTSARRLGIPTAALIPSWDNVSTKNRLLHDYQGYLVWSEETRRELRAAYPAARRHPVEVIGAVQFDVFHGERYHLDRQEFLGGLGLDPDRPVILHTVGSPNFLTGEPDAAEFVAEAVVDGRLGDVQLIVRPHPIHDDGAMAERFDRFGERVVVQRTSRPETPLSARTQNESAIVDWVNSFRHADVVVNLASTTSIDAALCDRPIVNIDYDPGPDGSQAELIHDINHLWDHFSPIAESGGMWLAGSPDELIEGIRTYLREPELHADGRRWMVEHVCQFTDGRCGERMARAIVDFAEAAISNPVEAAR